MLLVVGPAVERDQVEVLVLQRVRELVRHHAVALVVVRCRGDGVKTAAARVVVGGDLRGLRFFQRGREVEGPWQEAGVRQRLRERSVFLRAELVRQILAHELAKLFA